MVAVIRPYASVAFADDTSESQAKWPDGSFRDAAESAVATVAARRLPAPIASCVRHLVTPTAVQPLHPVVDVFVVL